MFHNAPNLWLTIDFSSRIHLDLAIISLVLYLPNIPTIYKGGCTPKQFATPKKHKISAKCPLKTFFSKTPRTSVNPNHPTTQKSHITKGPLFFFHPPTRCAAHRDQSCASQLIVIFTQFLNHKPRSMKVWDEILMVFLGGSCHDGLCQIIHIRLGL